MEGLLTLLLSDKLGVQTTAETKRERSPESARIRDLIRTGLAEKKPEDSNGGAK